MFVFSTVIFTFYLPSGESSGKSFARKSLDSCAAAVANEDNKCTAAGPAALLFYLVAIPSRKISFSCACGHSLFASFTLSHSFAPSSSLSSHSLQVETSSLPGGTQPTLLSI